MKVELDMNQKDEIVVQVLKDVIHTSYKLDVNDARSILKLEALMTAHNYFSKPKDILGVI